jgi:hypothetical protein
VKWMVTKPNPFTKKVASMDHATCATALLATPFAASLLPLTVRLLPVISRIGLLIVQFRQTGPTPQSCYEFESQLSQQLRQLGRIIVEWVYNDIEPDYPQLMPSPLHVDGIWYRRRGKTANRCVGTLFGAITLRRFLYQPIDGLERSIFPLEIRLGVEARRATPALAERAAGLAIDATQGETLQTLRREHAVNWSASTLRAVIEAVRVGVVPQGQAARAAKVLAWLERADASRGARKPVLAVGRDGIFVPIRGQDSYREAATGTLSIYDRRGHRLGTVYLGRMPEPGQQTISGQLTELIQEVLRRWPGPLPRLAYITDAGHHPTAYYRHVLKRMTHPRRPQERLHWEWVVDFYHAASYVSKLSEALFRTPRESQAWSRKMCRWLKTRPGAVNRILHSAAALRSRRVVLGTATAYREAYGYLRQRIGHLDYRRYKELHLPIGSGVTEAACKTVFTQRLKRSGMTWSVEGGQRIVDLRVIHLSGVWPEVYRSYLQSKTCAELGGYPGSGEEMAEKAA